MDEDDALIDRIERIRSDNNMPWIKLERLGGAKVADLREELRKRRDANHRKMQRVRKALKENRDEALALLDEIRAKDLRVVRLTQELAK